jgi:hypothetical protein
MHEAAEHDAVTNLKKISITGDSQACMVLGLPDSSTD